MVIGNAMRRELDRKLERDRASGGPLPTCCITAAESSPRGLLGARPSPLDVVHVCTFEDTRSPVNLPGHHEIHAYRVKWVAGWMNAQCPFNDMNCQVSCLCGDDECHRYCLQEEDD